LPQVVNTRAGVHQSFKGIGEVCKANGTLFLADTVCSLGGVPFFGDDWGVDAMYSGSQKALSAPPGSAPLMFGPRAFEKLSQRKTKVASYMNDLTLIGDYWGWYDKRFYHHTGMVSMTYALREALEVVKVRHPVASVQTRPCACTSKSRYLHEETSIHACDAHLLSKSTQSQLAGQLCEQKAIVYVDVAERQAQPRASLAQCEAQA
jgi:aspartate aminotransferase-like enzyme